jgi:hypothetical protein
MHFSFAIHYCGGTYAASKISVSGELASCGMEGTEDTCPLPGDHLKSHCCDDEVLVYAIDNTYTPSFSDAPDIAQKVFQLFSLSECDTFHSLLTVNALITNVCPPGKLFTSAVSLADICVFRN